MGQRLSVTRSFEWDATHRLLGHWGRCCTLHGHTYRAEVTVEAKMLTPDLGMVVDFSIVKRVIGEWIDQHWDHTAIVCRDDKTLLEFCVSEHRVGKSSRAPFVLEKAPTAEAMAMKLLNISQHRFDNLEQLGIVLEGPEVRYVVTKVVLFETPRCWATATRTE